MMEMRFIAIPCKQQAARTSTKRLSDENSNFGCFHCEYVVCNSVINHFFTNRQPTTMTDCEFW